MRSLVKARAKPGQEQSLIRDIDQQTLGNVRSPATNISTT
jgi:hypothetical protein